MVFRQSRVIIGPDLAQAGISEPPPLGGAHFQDHQILGAEQHRGQHPGNFGSRLFLRPVSPDLPGTAAGEQHKTQALVPLLGKDIPLNFREIRLEAHQFRSFLGAKTLSGTEIADGLQKIGLALGVITHDQVHPRGKFQGGAFIIPEILQR